MLSRTKYCWFVIMIILFFSLLYLRRRQSVALLLGNAWNNLHGCFVLQGLLRGCSKFVCLSPEDKLAPPDIQRAQHVLAASHLTHRINIPSLQHDSLFCFISEGAKHGLVRVGWADCPLFQVGTGKVTQHRWTWAQQGQILHMLFLMPISPSASRWSIAVVLLLVVLVIE